MHPIEFPQHNLLLAKDQPQYTPLPVFVDRRDVVINEVTHNIPYSATCCYELTDDDIADIIKNRKVFFQQMLYGNQFHPIFLSTKDPFVEENQQHWPADSFSHFKQ